MTVIKPRGFAQPRVGPAGAPGSYHIAVDWGNGSLWRHNSSGPGDLDILTSAGASYANITYDSYRTEGNVTVFGIKVLAAGFTLITKLEKKRDGCYLVTHTLCSDTARWIRLDRFMRDGAGEPTTNGSSHATSYANTVVLDADGQPFQAAALHHKNGKAVSLIPGNGFDNDWCLFVWDYTGSTSWFNQTISSKQAASVKLTYGLLKNGSTSDYTVRLEAGVSRDVSYVIGVSAPTSMAEYNRDIYNAYHDAYASAAKIAVRSAPEKCLWATAHQSYRIKRHILVEGAKNANLVTALYGPTISPGDILFQAMGLNDNAVTLNCLSLLHRIGPADGRAAGDNLPGSAGNNLDGTYGMWLPWFELWAKTFNGYIPDAAAAAKYLATADAYVEAITNGKMIPDASTRLAAYYSDLFGGSEGIGYGDFAEPFTFGQGAGAETRYRWTAAGATLPTRVTAEGGVTPRSGTYMAKLVNTSTLSMMRLAVPPSKTVNPTAYVNIPVAWSTGIRLQVLEYDATGTLVATTSGTAKTVTTGWEQITVSAAMTATTCYAVIVLDAAGTGTAYADDVQCTMVAPPDPGLMWNLNVMPPQLRADTLSVNTFAMVWAQLNLKCLKVLMGAAWTAGHEAALVAVNATFPAAFWLDGTHDRIIEDLYHPIRKTWLSSFALFGHYLWYLISGGTKIVADADILRIYDAYPTAFGLRPYGNVMRKGWVYRADGLAFGAESAGTAVGGGSPQTNSYIAGGGWLWASDAFFTESALWAGHTAAAQDKRNRAALEVDPSLVAGTTSYHSHEALNSATGAPTGAGYGTNALVLAGELAP